MKATRAIDNPFRGIQFFVAISKYGAYHHGLIGVFDTLQEAQEAVAAAKKSRYEVPERRLQQHETRNQPHAVTQAASLLPGNDEAQWFDYSEYERTYGDRDY